MDINLYRTILKAAIIISCAIIGIATTALFKMAPDNPIEEICEQVIKVETGIDVDLTPQNKN